MPDLLLNIASVGSDDGFEVLAISGGVNLDDYDVKHESGAGDEVLYSLSGSLNKGEVKHFVESNSDFNSGATASSGWHFGLRKNGTEVDAIDVNWGDSYADVGVFFDDYHNSVIRNNISYSENKEDFTTTSDGGDALPWGELNPNQSSSDFVSAPSQPRNASITVDANDQITFNWDDPSDWGGDQVNYRVQMERDGGSWEYPSGGPNTPSSGSNSETYGPNSDNSYQTQVGIDSSFRFRIRAENSAGNSGWDYSSTKYTDPIPPHNPSISRPDANTVKITTKVKSDISEGVDVDFREDTGSGYGSWTNLENIHPGDEDSGSTNTKGSTVEKSFSVGTSYDYDQLQSDSRYQFRIRHWSVASGSPRSDWVYADYGNDGNVYFEDDFESGDLSAWDSNNIAGVTGVKSTDGLADLTISGADEGTYYFYGEGEGSDDGTWLQKDLGDLSNETDVIVKCAFATASLDNSTEDFGISWYDGSSWQSLKHFQWEYNKQGWYEVSALVPSSYLNSNSQIRVGTTTDNGMYGGDHFAVDRVVVSDILHEYTKPAAPSSLSLDNSTEDEITATWTENATFEDNAKVPLSLDGSRVDNKYEGPNATSTTFTGLNDGEQYNVELLVFTRQYRNGTGNSFFNSSKINDSTTTKLPAPTSLSVSNIQPTTADLSWTDNADNEDAYRVLVEEDGEPTGMQFDPANNEEIDLGIAKELEFGIDDFTVATKVKADSISNYKSICSISRYDESLLVRVNDGGLQIYVAGNSYTPTSLQTGTVYDIIITRTNSTVETFVNGESVGTNSAGGDMTVPKNSWIGGNQHSEQYWDGEIYHLQAYNRSLSSSERDSIRSGSVISNGLRGYWPLDQNNGGTTPDLSEYSNDGTVNGPTIVGAGLTDKSGALGAGTTSYTLSSLLETTTYDAYVQAETEHSVTRDM